MHNSLFKSKVPQPSLAALEGGNVYYDGFICCVSCTAWIKAVRYAANEYSDWPLLGCTTRILLYSWGLHLRCASSRSIGLENRGLIESTGTRTGETLPWKIRQVRELSSDIPHFDFASSDGASGWLVTRL